MGLAEEAIVTVLKLVSFAPLLIVKSKISLTFPKEPPDGMKPPPPPEHD